MLDARAAGRFTGEVPKPRGASGPAISRARSLPYTDLLNADGTFRPPMRCAHGWRRPASIARARGISCGSAVTACILTLGLRLAGLPEGAVYDGSWTEWGGRSAHRRR